MKSKTKKRKTLHTWLPILLLSCLVFSLSIMILSLTLILFCYFSNSRISIDIKIFDLIGVVPFVAIITVSALFVTWSFVLLIMYFCRLNKSYKEMLNNQTDEQMNIISEEYTDKTNKLDQENIQFKSALNDGMPEENSDVIPIRKNEEIEKLRQDVVEAEGIANYYKKQLEKLRKIPDLKDTIVELLPIITALGNYTKVTVEDRERFVSIQERKLIDFLNSQNMQIILSNEGDVYNPDIHSSQGSVSSSNETQKNTIQTSVCCGIALYDGTIIKEKVILYL